MSHVIYLVRHAIAAPTSPGMADADRQLTPEGQRKMVRVVRGLKRLGVTPDRVVSSPLIRARETAALVVAGLVPGLAAEIEDTLAPGHVATDTVRALSRYRSASNLVLTGHEPGMGELASQLLTGSSSLASLPFKKGGIAAIRVSALPPRSDGELLWFLTPKQLRLMAR